MDCHTIRKLQAQVHLLQQQLTAAAGEVCPTRNICNQSLTKESYTGHIQPGERLGQQHVVAGNTAGNTPLPLQPNFGQQQRQPHNTSPTVPQPAPAQQQGKNRSPAARNPRGSNDPFANQQGRDFRPSTI